MITGSALKKKMVAGATNSLRVLWIRNILSNFPEGRGHIFEFPLPVDNLVKIT